MFSFSFSTATEFSTLGKMDFVQISFSIFMHAFDEVIQFNVLMTLKSYMQVSEIYNILDIKDRGVTISQQFP